MDEFKKWLAIHSVLYIGSGSQGYCYKIGNKVFKIFSQYVYDDYEDDEDFIIYSSWDIMRYSSLSNDTYVFPNDIISVGEVIVGYITNYVDGKALYKINPLNISLDKFAKSLENVPSDIRFISDNGVLSFDVAYNIMYGVNGFNVLDTLEYSMTDINSQELFKKNSANFNYGIKLFLIDGYFDTFISYYQNLYDMYHDPNVDILLFLNELRDKLSNVEGHSVSRLRDAKKSMVRIKRMVENYIREY